MSIKQSIDNFLSTANLPDNLRNWANGFAFVVGQVESDRVTKTVLREIYNGLNRNSDSGRILNPTFALFDKIILTEVINNTSDANLKTKMTTLLSEVEAWLNS